MPYISNDAREFLVCANYADISDPKFKFLGQYATDKTTDRLAALSGTISVAYPDIEAGVQSIETTDELDVAGKFYADRADEQVCSVIEIDAAALTEAKRRGLARGVKNSKTAEVGFTEADLDREIASIKSETHFRNLPSDTYKEISICSRAARFIEKYSGVVWLQTTPANALKALNKPIEEAKLKKLDCPRVYKEYGIRHRDVKKSYRSEFFYCYHRLDNHFKNNKRNAPYIGAYERYIKSKNISCAEVIEENSQVAFYALVDKPSIGFEKNKSQNETQIERQKRIAAEAELAALKAKQEKQQQTISADKQVLLITITQSGTDQRKGIIRGFARDNVRVAEVLVDGVTVSLGSGGSFEWSGFVPATGKDVIIEAFDTAALSSRQVVRLERSQIQQASGPRFDDLDPTAGKRVKRNENALALIVGISEYERTDAPAIYADKDAQYFHDYASLKLGIPDSNITTMINEKAEQGDVYLAVVDWLSRSSKPGKSDVYIFFAGHGLASQDGEQMYLLPYDGRPRLLDKTAILRDELFDDIAAANPRSVTVFLDTCYSGTTRGPDMLIASRPISIRAKESAIPKGFTVMTAAAGDQTAKPLEEAKHGMFSYFLMKGMEGDADANSDNEITAGELHAYVQQNVIQQSSSSQTPELQGDADRVLVRFQ